MNPRASLQAKTYSISQCNTVASCVKDQQDGRLFPQIKDLADVSKKVALAVAEEVMRLGLTSMSASIEFEERLKKIVWEPAYPEKGGYRRFSADSLKSASWSIIQVDKGGGL